MPLKYKVYLTDNEAISATLTIDIKMSKTEEAIAQALAMSDQERNNAIGQKLIEISNMLGNTDEL
jgi:hypothetical protein